MTDLSQRGAGFLRPLPETEYLAAFEQMQDDRWHLTENPAGAVQFAVAENVHTWAELEPPMRARVVDRGFADYVPHYGDVRGHRRFREALLRYMRRHVFLDRGRPLADQELPFSADHLMVTNGCGPALEHLTFALCDPGDAILTPSPIYAGFLMDVGRRAQAQLITVAMDSHRRYRFDTEALESSLAEARARGVRVRALLLSQPYNPLGVCLAPAEVEWAVHWCHRHDLHLISDEIYAASVFAPGVVFTSATAFLAGYPQMASSVHVLYGLSKDFGLSGFRVGVICSTNSRLNRALHPLSDFCGCSSLPQDLLTAVLDDEPRVDAYLAHNRSLLHRVYRKVAAAAERIGIPYLPADSGFFVWLDLGRWLDEPTAAAEHELWSALLEEARVLLTPGLSCRASAPGMFRLCFAAVPEAAVDVGMERLGRFLKRRGGRPRGGSC